jgi:hypothetical protein
LTLKIERVPLFIEGGSLMQAALGREALLLDGADRKFPMVTSARAN